MIFDRQSPYIRSERWGDVLWIWIDREARRNAINAAVLAGIGDALQEATDPAVRAAQAARPNRTRMITRAPFGARRRRLPARRTLS